MRQISYRLTNKDTPPHTANVIPNTATIAAPVGRSKTAEK